MHVKAVSRGGWLIGAAVAAAVAAVGATVAVAPLALAAPAP